MAIEPKSSSENENIHDEKQVNTFQDGDTGRRKSVALNIVINPLQVNQIITGFQQFLIESIE